MTKTGPDLGGEGQAPTIDSHNRQKPSKCTVNSSHGQLVTQSTRHNAAIHDSQLVTPFWAILGCDELTVWRVDCIPLTMLCRPPRKPHPTHPSHTADRRPSAICLPWRVVV